jgi:hypothetical protein
LTSACTPMRSTSACTPMRSTDGTGVIESSNGSKGMIKQKGVCDVCGREFELDEGSFGITISEEDRGASGGRWTITFASCAHGCLNEGFSHVCGMACLYEAISGAVDKKHGEPDFKVIGYDGADDTDTRVLDIKDRKLR